MMSVVDHGCEPLPCQNKEKQLIFAVSLCRHTSLKSKNKDLISYGINSVFW
jgi:hypothetical protein